MKTAVDVRAALNANKKKERGSNQPPNVKASRKKKIKEDNYDSDYDDCALASNLIARRQRELSAKRGRASKHGSKTSKRRSDSDGSTRR